MLSLPTCIHSPDETFQTNMSNLSMLNHLIKEPAKLKKHIFSLFLQSKRLITPILLDQMILLKHLINTQDQVPIFINNG